MTESQPLSSETSEKPESKSNSLAILLAVIVALGAASYLYFSGEKTVPAPTEPVVVPQPEVVVEPEVQEVIEEVVEVAPEPIVELPQIIEEPVVEEVPKVELPLLDNSDSWVKQKLSELTWRKELLRLVIDDDMVRRLVVFTDNFAQGLVSYEYSPLTQPKTKFSATELNADTQPADTTLNSVDNLDNSSVNAMAKQQWLWNDAQSARFKLYVDLLRSFEPEQLATWYFELKPLIDQAYGELGYEDQDFTEVLQDALVRVLDMEFPNDDVVLVRPSVMYKYAEQDLEQLPEADKLLLRVGKDNLLVIKSFLLEFSDALARAQAEQ
ncbi:DUF3014 domain-containing protein [Thalassotalea euphylliae]|uniref:DUF3014 domain-containing protein n=1 Tax=Thalassotalea euphylliae TaxID=1655234 RepID=A0A3E0U8B7_9GAMM|nr:DUF3014 domain-containing protein [Thalassotalea euphylliae]REL32355.1 DUF3014 domain-containing protein [Thalassotalea euphylliae]